MTRTQWLILALGVVVILVASLYPRRDAGGIPGLPEELGGDPERAALGTPELYMETATISQHTADGALGYRLVADRITHYSDVDRTLLEMPRLTFYGVEGPRWTMAAGRGRIVGGGGLLEESAPRVEPTLQTVVLEEDVRVWRTAGAAPFVELRTEELTLLPEREYAHTDRAVMIRSDSSRTRAAGLEADLGAGRFVFAPAPGGRVRTTIFPDELP